MHLCSALSPPHHDIHKTNKNAVQAISCHYASSDCYYIDVKGTTQENIEKEVHDIAARKYDMGNEITFQVRDAIQKNHSRFLSYNCATNEKNDLKISTRKLIKKQTEAW